MAIKINNDTVIDNSKNVNAGVGTFTALDVPPQAITFSPTDGATSVNLNTNIVITFNYTLSKGTGNITLRNGSAAGSIIETIAVSSGAVTVSGAQVTINPTSNLPTSTDVYVVVDAGAFTNGLDNVGGGNSIINTYNFTTTSFTLSSFTPLDEATDVLASSNITLTFTSAPSKGTGTITLRTGSAGGTIVESFDAASSGRISISGNDWILDPTSTLDFSTVYYLVIPDGAIQNYEGTSTYNFTSEAAPLGSNIEGGYLICASGGINWIVAPVTTTCSTTWYGRGAAVTRAQQVTGCTGWFIPTCAQLQNPGYACRVYWDAICNNQHWSDTSWNGIAAWTVNPLTGARGSGPFQWAGSTFCSRAFRCVAY